MLDIYIIHSGRTEDESLVQFFVTALQSSPAKLVLITADELIKRYESIANIQELNQTAFVRWTTTHLRGFTTGVQILFGTMIVILSEKILRDSVWRAALLAATGDLSIIAFRRYFISSGIDPEEIVARYPDLAPIYENLMIRRQDEAPKITEDLMLMNFFLAEKYLSGDLSGTAPFVGDSPAKAGVKLGVGTLIFVPLLLAQRLYSARFVFAAALTLFLYKRLNSSLTLIVLLLSAYTAGIGLSRIDALDLWPWLGRCWKWSTSLDWLHSARERIIGFGPLAVAGLASGIVAAAYARQRSFIAVGFIFGYVVQAVLDGVCIYNGVVRRRGQRSGYPPKISANSAICGAEHLVEAVNACWTIRWLNLFTVFAPVLAIALVVAVGAAHFSYPVMFATTALFLTGAMTPTIVLRAFLASTEYAVRGRGLTTSMVNFKTGLISGASRGWTPFPLGIEETDIASFSTQERDEFRRFTFQQRTNGRKPAGPWLSPKEFAFISYVRRDEERRKTAANLDETLRRIEVPSFRDTRVIQDQFGVWRASIAPVLLQCSHFFLVASPGIKSGKVVLREIETVIERVYTEMLPAIICVINPDEARSLRDDPEVPLHVRFLLTCCPQMSISEASDPQQLRYMIDHTRRQGKMADWITTLSSRAARQRIVRMSGIVQEASLAE